MIEYDYKLTNINSYKYYQNIYWFTQTNDFTTYGLKNKICLKIIEDILDENYKELFNQFEI